MEMTQRSSEIKRDMAFGQAVMITSTPDGDNKHDIDYIIGGGFGLSWRTRRFKVSRYNEISIRYKRNNGAKTQYQKILDGECQSYIFVFDFLDAYVVCSLPAITKAIKENIGYPQENNDKETWAYYINIDKIAHLLFKKA